MKKLLILTVLVGLLATGSAEAAHKIRLTGDGAWKAKVGFADLSIKLTQNGRELHYKAHGLDCAASAVGPDALAEINACTGWLRVRYMTSGDSPLVLTYWHDKH